MIPLLIALGLLVVPVAVGYGAGRAACRVRARRFGGVLVAAAIVMATSLGALLLCSWRPVLGFWDALVEGGLVGVGVLLGGHQWFARRRDTVLVLISFAVSLLLFEAGVRRFLEVQPRFSVSDDPSLLLANALLVNATTQGWDTGSNEVVCSAIYGPAYERKLNRASDAALTLPQRFAPRADKRRRVLHVGDSMVYGLGVPPSERFTTLLEQLEPDTEHINAALPGTAPDSYFAVVHAWEQQPIDLVVMYLYSGNDYAGLDSPSPCCNFEPILKFDGGRAVLRCPAAIPFDLDNVRLDVLRLISPPPYLLRALIPGSHGAAALAAALVTRKVDGSMTPAMQETLDEIIASAAAELRSRGVPLVVVTLADRSWVEHANASPEIADRMLESARRADVPALDARPVFRAAAERGAALYLVNDGHFNPAGHALMARWLSDTLPRR